jgi:hypothetical protein
MPALLRFRLAVFASRLVYSASGSLLGLALGDAAIFVTFLDVLVLPIAFAVFLYASRHEYRLLVNIGFDRMQYLDQRGTAKPAATVIR